MAALKAVILDVDGTLIDSNDAHARSWVEVLAEFGFQVAFDRVRTLIGKGGDKLLPEVSGVHKDTPRGREISARRAEVFKRDYLPRLRPFPGARALLERIRADGLGLVVATSANADEAAALLRAAGVDDLLDDRTSSSDAERSKPDPDIVRAALASARLTPGEAVMIGDTPYDVESAGRAGVPIIALRCGGWDDAALRGATAIYQDPSDLLAHYDASPLARR